MKLPAFVRRLRSRSAEILSWAIIGVSFVLSYASFVRYQVFFTPDSRYYLAMAFLFGGDSPETARDRTIEFASHYGIEVPQLDLLFGWGLVQPRVVLPTLAAPFVKLFGPYGLALTTLIITVVLIIVIAIIVTRRYGLVVGTATMLLVNGSFYLMSYFGSMLTESLSALWTAIALIASWRWISTRNRWWLVVAGGVTVASAFTRQATLIVAGAVLVAWVLGSLIERRNSAWMWPAIVITAASLGSQLVQSLVFPSFSQLDQFLRMTGTDSLGAALLAVPGLVTRILWSDFQLLLRYDRVLIFLIGMAVVGMLLFWRRAEAHLLLGAILATGLYNITNGNPTQFRYAVPGIIFFVIMAAYVLSRTGGAIARRNAVLAGEGGIVSARRAPEEQR